ncbi:MAG: radical SAM protein [Deltaproteobacteria bacterium]|nr:radical SAM protein [Deltaproteobacteria bacterium]
MDFTGAIAKLKHYWFMAVEHPYILPRIGRSMLLAWGGRHVLRGVELAITYRCQARCRHCLQTKLVHPETKELTPEEIGCIADDFLALGGININITGGEALLRDDLIDCIEAARPNKAFVTLATNGYLVTRPMVRELKRAGIRMVTISLDAPDAETHDRIRGLPGSFDAVIRGARYFKEAGIRVFLNTIMTKENTENGDIYRIVDLTRSEGHVCTINLPYAVGAWEGVRDNRLNPEQIKEYWRLIHQPGVRWEGDANYLKEGCPAGTEKIYITPYGDVMPCAVIHSSFGNIRKKSLYDIYFKMRSMDIFKDVHGLCMVGANTVFQTRVLDRINRAARNLDAVDAMVKPLEEITYSEVEPGKGELP